MFDNSVEKIIKLFSLYKEVIIIADKIINDDEYCHPYTKDYNEKRKELDEYKKSIFNKKSGGERV